MRGAAMLQQVPQERHACALRFQPWVILGDIQIPMLITPHDTQSTTEYEEVPSRSEKNSLLLYERCVFRDSARSPG